MMPSAPDTLRAGQAVPGEEELVEAGATVGLYL
jgi:hypothetical protein